jgi:transposase-like protein
MNTTITAQKIETEIPERASRRRFTKEYKLRILQQADCCTKQGEIGALLRREGLYSSHLSDWRSQRHEGTLKALERKRGPKPKRTAEHADVEKLRRENDRLRERLRKAEKIIEVQKKLSEVLGLDSDDTEEPR